LRRADFAHALPRWNLNETESSARLEHAEDAHQAIGDLVSLGNLARLLLHRDLLLKVAKRPSRLLGHLACALFDPLGAVEQKAVQRSIIDILAIDQLRHLCAVGHRQVPAKDHSVEA